MEPQGKGVSFKRAYEAVDGNWPSFIYLPVSKLDFLHVTCAEHFRKANNIALEDLELEERDPHISLSKPFALRRHQINSFVAMLGNEVSSVFKNRFALAVYREYYILNNDTKTRSFVCLPVEDRSSVLSKLVSVVDTVMRNFNRPEYYALPKFHLSVASLLYREGLAHEVIVEVPCEAETGEKKVEIGVAKVAIGGKNVNVDGKKGKGKEKEKEKEKEVEVEEEAEEEKVDIYQFSNMLLRVRQQR